MDALAGAAGAVAGFLKPGKAKLVHAEAEADAGGGLAAAAGALASALPIPGLGPEDKDTELTFMFNPTEYRLSQRVNVHHPENTAKPAAGAQYVGTGPLRISMQLFFDDFASAQGDVTPKINKLLKWQKPAKEGEPPPLVKFQWSNKYLDEEDFKGVIEDLTVTYTVFRRDGTPIQAKVDVTLVGATELKAGTNPTSHAMDTRRVRVVIEGESLATIAHAELGRPGYWRAIAELNGIDDPLRLAPGTSLLIPSPADAGRSA